MKRIVKKQLKLQEKSLEKFLAKREVVVSSDNPNAVQFITQTYDDEDDDDDEGVLSKIGNIFRVIFENLLEIVLIVGFGGVLTYFIVNEQFRTFIINFISSFFK